MLTLILAESSLETIPSELQNHPSVTSYCKRSVSYTHLRAHKT